MRRRLLTAFLSALTLFSVGFAADSQSVVIFLGPPCAGKGTNAVRLHKALGYPHISMGDLLREEVKTGTPLGAKAKAFMDKGEFMPSALILDILFSRIAKADCEQGFILDGFPRTLEQAAALRDHLGDNAKVMAFNFDVPDEVIIERVSGRVICADCYTPYHLRTLQPKVEGQCDLCNGKLEQRPDDTEEVIRKRLKIYHEQTQPLVVFYQREGHLVGVDTHKTLDQITEQVMQALDAMKKEQKATASETLSGSNIE
jgi:adenylate kinase